MPDWMTTLWLFPAGLVAGTLNVMAGGGSFLTLPLLIFLGLPATVANGTNRVAILFQSAGAAWSFNRHKVMDWRRAFSAALPAAVGAGLGTAAALVIGDEAFQKILASVMVVITLWTLLGRMPSGSGAVDSPSGRQRLGLAAGFFFVGIYGGFVQAGVGFLILAVTTLAGLDLVRGNTVKVVCILVFTVLSLGIFAWQGMVHWPMGLVLATGNTLGGLIGAKLTILKGHGWIRGVVTVTVVVFAIRLWFW